MLNKTGLTLMVSGVKDGKYLLEHCEKKSLGKPQSIGKSCIRFQKLDDLNKDALRELLKEASVADVSCIAV